LLRFEVLDERIWLVFAHDQAAELSEDEDVPRRLVLLQAHESELEDRRQVLLEGMPVRREGRGESVIERHDVRATPPAD
jgi:hypothetical protein